MDTRSSSRYWLSQAARQRRLANTLIWLDEFATPWLVLSLLLCPLLLLFRQQSWDTFALFYGYGMLTLLLALFASFRMRGKALTTADTLLRLETHLALKNQLTAAQAKAAPWPEPHNHPIHAYTIHWPKVGLPFLASSGFILLGQLLPIAQPDPGPSFSQAQPPAALTELESMIETLESIEVVQETAVETLNSQFETLRERSPEEWYGQSGLEAAEHLRDQTRSALQELSKNLQQTEAILEQAFANPDLPLNPDSLETLQTAYLEQLDQLTETALPLDTKLLNKLKQLDFQSLDTLDKLSPEAQQALQQQLRECASKGGECSGLNASDLQMISQEQQQALMQKMGIGQGGIERGPGTAPLLLSELATPASASTVEAISNKDLSNIGLGDTLEIRTRPGNAPPPSFNSAQPSDTRHQQGQGGDTVWNAAFTPKEKEILQRYFK